MLRCETGAGLRLPIETGEPRQEERIAQGEGLSVVQVRGADPLDSPPEGPS